MPADILISQNGSISQAPQEGSRSFSSDTIVC